MYFLLTGFTAQAQLTVFNVSSSEITDYHKISARQQFEIQDQVESLTIVTYGLGKGSEIGANLINIDYGLQSRHFETNDSATSLPYAPLLLNAQKVFTLNQTFSVGVGSVAGISVKHLKSARLVYYSYANLNASFGHDDRFQIAAGPHYSNHRYLSDGPIWACRWALMPAYGTKRSISLLTGFPDLIRKGG